MLGTHLYTARMSRYSLALALALCACSSSGGAGSGTTVMGTLGGSAFEPKDAISYVDATTKTAEVVLTSTPDACMDVTNNVQRANARVVLILVSDTTAADTKLATGTYPTSYTSPAPARSSAFESNVTDAQCNVSYDPPPDGTGDGSITVTSVSDTISGSFDVVMENGEHVTGTFHPTACPQLGGRSPMPTCAP